MKLYYANQAGHGLAVIIGEAGQEAHSVEANRYRADAIELEAELEAIRAEYATEGEPIRFATVAELAEAYNCPMRS